ncbi:Predicted arabinose efflux permease, MFS family [Microbulbifer donghaiensis]|uniref:Predicted arabinose efflux permease, MFS family n=1 Tax=Microbulbifer donghaiensis TaxID=494016 RepID=A0A1M4Z0G7_9GAMM|nr:MFS transporter [Microbulbifer donghaiensis]SHF11448.1 Predicted arabinose efflux permease, MFS family [Microbulbifer donghaiensis]
MKSLPLSAALPVVTAALLSRRITLLCLAALTVMSGATIAPSLPALQSHFATAAHSELLTRLVLTLPALFIAISAPIAGTLSDRFGRLPLLLASVLLYGLAGLSGLLQDSLAGILAGRALLGIAVGGTMTSVTALVGDYFSGREREIYMSQQGAFISLGGVVFLIGGGLLADLHWRAPFAIYGLALALVPAVLLFLHEPRRDSESDSGTPTGLTPASPELLAALLIAALLNSLAFFLIPTQLPFRLQEIGISQPSLTGLAIAGGNLLGAFSSLLLYRRIRALLGPLGVFAFSFAIMSAGLTLISTATTFNSVMTATAIYGIGMGTMMPHLFATAIQLAPPRIRGRVSGGLAASIFLGQFLSPLVSQPWISRFGLASAFAAMGLLLVMLAGFSATALLWRRIRNTQ